MKQIKTMTKEELLMGSVDLISKTYIELGQNNVEEDTIRSQESDKWRFYTSKCSNIHEVAKKAQGFNMGCQSQS